MAQVIKRENNEWKKEQNESIVTKCMKCQVLEIIEDIHTCHCEDEETDR